MQLCVWVSCIINIVSYVSCDYNIYHSLGQGCNHVAALLFFIEHHVHTGQDILATEVSKTSKPMAWNQPPKKEVNPARAKDINFVNPSHSDLLAEDAEKPSRTSDTISILGNQHIEYLT